jgi:hypothetical protein
MGLKLTFIKSITKQEGINTTFRDSSSRTRVLKEAELQRRPKKKSMLDKNATNHRVSLLRRSG